MNKRLLLSMAIVPLLAFMLPQKKVKIFLAGDSTCAIKETKAYPETGWGMPFVYFWDSTVQVVNLAKNGRSTSSFRREGLWDKIMSECSKGDYVLIQFGHNDEIPTKKNATTETEFKNNLTQYVSETKAKGANPVLITPVARRRFDSAGKITGTHDVYAQIVRVVAAEQKVPMIDLDVQSQQLYQQLGVEHSKLLFLHLAPGEHPNYPKGKTDDTHFSELGARLVAQIVLKNIRTIVPDLAQRSKDAAVK
ncbi:MAG: rhamnogalacturonan acetylesterase [Niabella sp.]